MNRTLLQKLRIHHPPEKILLLSGPRQVGKTTLSEMHDEASRFEYFIMSHLLKTCHTWTDFGLGEYRLWYVRDREKREVDALITQDNKPWLMVEIKLNDLNLSKSLQRFSRLLNCRKVVQVVKPDGVYRQMKVDSRIYHIASAGIFLRWFE